MQEVEVSGAEEVVDGAGVFLGGWLAGTSRRSRELLAGRQAVEADMVELAGARARRRVAAPSMGLLDDGEEGELRGVGGDDEEHVVARRPPCEMP